MAKTQRSTGKREDGANLSARGRAGLKRHAEACIDTFLTSVGIKDPSDQTDKNGWRHFQLGSARGFAYVVETDDDVIVHAAAKVMDLPSDKDLTLPLFRELLELNLMLPGRTRLGVRENQVFAAATESATLIEDAEYGRHVHRVMALADAVDDKLQEKYQGTTKKRAAK
jgi:hypothetical protein